MTLTSIESSLSYEEIKNIFSHFNCSISHSQFQDPVTLPESGLTYDRDQLIYFENKDPTTKCSVTNYRNIKSTYVIKAIMENLYKYLGKFILTEDILEACLREDDVEMIEIILEALKYNKKLINNGPVYIINDDPKSIDDQPSYIKSIWNKTDLIKLAIIDNASNCAAFIADSDLPLESDPENLSEIIYYALNENIKNGAIPWAFYIEKDLIKYLDSECIYKFKSKLLKMEYININELKLSIEMINETKNFAKIIN